MNSRLPALVAGLTALVVATVALTGCTSKAQPDRDAAAAYLAAYASHDIAAAAGRTTDTAAAVAALTATLAGLPEATPTFKVGAVSDRKDTSSAVAYTASWKFGGSKAAWSYSGSLAMAKAGSTWQVRWASTDVAPGLTDGQHLSVQRTQPPRANLLDRAGQPLFTDTPVVTVGIDPAQVTDLNGLAARLAAVPQLQTTTAEVVASVQQNGQNFAPIVTLRRDDYLQIRDQVHDLAGTAFQEGTELLGPSTTFAQPLLGRLGAATAEQITKSGGAIVAGDRVGQSGLQQALNTQLAGTPGLTVQAVDAAGTVVHPVATVGTPQAGQDVTLTLDRATQTAAQATVNAVALPASVVVTQPSTGVILAAANNLAAAGEGDLALAGQFPPGSTFKIATYTAALRNDPTLAPTSTADCPVNFVFNGQTIRNEDDFAKGTIALSAAFAFSCNTTAANLALKLPAGALAKAAASLGLGQKWALPVDAFAGSMPAAATGNELAAEGYGQGQVLVSPLLMAEMAGGAATGVAIAPSIVQGQAGGRLPVAARTVTAYLNTLMRDVVTQPGATGRGLADLPGTVEGKTGTAEYGSAGQSHSWFAGTRGDMAFSVFVLGGEKSTDTSVPITHALLQSLP